MQTAESQSALENVATGTSSTRQDMLRETLQKLYINDDMIYKYGIRVQMSKEEMKGLMVAEVKRSRQRIRDYKI